MEGIFNMTNAQEFNTLSREFCLSQADKVVNECKECGGTGMVHVAVELGGLSHDFFESYDEEPCPSCQRKVKEWRKLADEFCWHKILATGRLLTGDYPNQENPTCQGDWMLGDIYVCNCGFIGIDSTSRKIASEGKWVEHSGNSNPTYSNPADIAAALKRMGLWDKFTTWLWMKFIPNAELDQYGIFDILTTPALFLEAGKNFLREVVGQP